MSESMKRIEVTFLPADLDRINTEAAKQGISRAQFIRDRALNNQGKTALDLIDHDMEFGMWDRIKQMLETEYSQIDVTESVEN